MQASSLRFAAAAKALAAEARRRGLVVPAFRAPPRLAGADRTLRRRPDGGATVSVQLRDRPWPAVVADMVEGIVVANRLVNGEADGCRDALWRAVDVPGADLPGSWVA